MNALALALYVALVSLAFAFCAVVTLPANLAPVLIMLFGGTP